MNAVLGILRAGAPWRDLPSEFGKWGSVHQRFRRWRDAGVWERILRTLAKGPNFEWLMIDASRWKSSSPYNRSDWRRRRNGRTKGGLKIHLDVDVLGRPIRALVTEGVNPDCKKAISFIENLSRKALLANRGYDPDEIIKCAKISGFLSSLPKRIEKFNEHTIKPFIKSVPSSEMPSFA